MKLRCELCSKWKKDYGVWAHNMWTKDYRDDGVCLCSPEVPEKRQGKEASCKEFEQAPPKKDKFGPPVDKL